MDSFRGLFVSVINNVTIGNRGNMSVEAEVVFLPRDLGDVNGRTVVVFDVLRATTSMAAALDAGVRQIRIFQTKDELRAAGRPADVLWCGEDKCLRPTDFDLGNSPGDFNQRDHADKTLFMSTTNGTRAILAAGASSHVFAGALVNAKAVACAVMKIGRPVTLLCAGTDGRVAIEDVAGAAAVLEAMQSIHPVTSIGDATLLAQHLFNRDKTELFFLLGSSQGGQNIYRAGLEKDVKFASRLNAIDIVPRIGRDAGVTFVRRDGD